MATRATTYQPAADVASGTLGTPRRIAHGSISGNGLRRRRGPPCGRSVGRQPADTANALLVQLRGVGEPEGLRRLVEGDVVRGREAADDHNGTPLSRERTGARVVGKFQETGFRGRGAICVPRWE